MIGPSARTFALVAITPLQFGLSGFLEFAVLFMPLLGLGSIALMTYWALGKFILPRLLRGRTSPTTLVIYATPLVIAVVFIVASFLRKPTGYWVMFAYLVFLTGMIEGGVLIYRLAKIVSQLTSIGSESDTNSESDDSSRHRANVVRPEQQGTLTRQMAQRIDQSLEDRFGVGLKTILKKISEWILKWWYKRKVTRDGTIMALAGALLAYLFAKPRVTSVFQLAEFVLSTFVAIVTINLLLWKLTKLTVADDPATKMDTLPVVGALVIVAATTVVRLPDTFLPGANQVQAFLAQHIPYARRVVEALFTIPVLDFVVIIIYFVGILVGSIIALYVWRREKRQVTA